MHDAWLLSLVRSISRCTARLDLANAPAAIIYDGKEFTMLSASCLPILFNKQTSLGEVDAFSMIEFILFGRRPLKLLLKLQYQLHRLLPLNQY